MSEARFRIWQAGSGLREGQIWMTQPKKEIRECEIRIPEGPVKLQQSERCPS
jgi:hypothetical protein